MKPKSYRYSLFYLLARLFNFSLLLYIALKPYMVEHSLFWIYLKKAMVVITIYLIVELMIRQAIPLIRKKYAVELNDNGLFYRVKNRIVGWSEIKEIKPSPYGFSSLKIILNNGKKFSIRTDEIRGGDNEIYQDILAYLEKSKAQPKPI